MERYGENFYSDIGHKGGSKLNTKPKGFAYAKLNLTEDSPAHPRNAGGKGGAVSRRGTKNGTSRYLNSDAS
jgi:general stress protein YciG